MCARSLYLSPTHTSLRTVPASSPSWRFLSTLNSASPRSLVCDSDQTKSELAAVRDYPRTNLTNLTASFWEYYGGRAGFEFWNDQPTRAIDDYHLDIDPPVAARVYATADVRFADASIACWDAKYTYWEARPAMLDPSITTSFVTPNHPSYPSAHSCLSGTYASILAHFFPRDTEYYQGLAAQAGEARIMGGIHLPSDIRAGEAIARSVSEVVWLRAMGQRLP